jgi:hypothetical protein
MATFITDKKRGSNRSPKRGLIDLQPNPAKRQKPKKHTAARLKAIRQTRIKNLRSKQCQEN